MCAVAFTKREKSDAIIFKSRRSRLSLFCIFRYGHALPLSKTKVFRLANGSPMIQRCPVRRSSSDCKPSGKTSNETSLVMAAKLPDNGRTVATAMSSNVHLDDLQDNLPCARREYAMSTPEICETTRGMIVQQPGRSRATVKATSHEWLVEILVIGF